MGNAFMMRRGGENPLNFSVHVGAQAPAEPVENTIWVAADVKSPEWAIAQENPYVAYRDVDLLDGAATAAGFISTSGSVSAQNAANLEVYTQDYIPVSTGETYRYRYGMSSEVSQWLAICEYKADRTFIRRTVLVNSVTGVLAEGTYTPASGEVAYVRLAWRTFGDTMMNVSLIAPDRPYTPDTVEMGTVFIRTSQSASTAFNALKKNGLIVCPAEAMIWDRAMIGDGGAWWSPTAKIYQNGAWTELKEAEVYLYLEGDLCSAVSGGWTNTAGSLTLNVDNMWLTGSKAVLHTISMIDLTEFSKIRFTVLAGSSSAQTIVGVHTTTASESFTASVDLPNSMGGYADFDVNVSPLSGSYYVKIQTSATNVGCYVKAVRLIK